MKKTNDEKFNLLYEELADWMQGNDYDGGLEYAFNNDFQLHAINLWMNTGASNYNFSVKIDAKEESKEVKALLAQAYILECPDCNHLGFYNDCEAESGDSCMSCTSKNTILREPQNEK